jgi:hypothetical protein
LSESAPRLAHAAADATAEAQAATDECVPAIQRVSSLFAAARDLTGHDFETLRTGYLRRALVDVVEARAAGCAEQEQ